MTAVLPRGSIVSGVMTQEEAPRARPRLIGLVWPFIAVVLVQLLVAGLSLYTMSAVRAYVGGESLWSKGQKEAIYFLNRYADTGREAFFQHYEQAIAVPMADRRARMDLKNRNPTLPWCAKAFSPVATIPTTSKG